MKFNDVAIVYIKGSDYRFHFCYTSKDDAMWIMNNSNLNEKSRSLWLFLLYIKMRETTYYQRNRETILNRAKEHYKNDKERLSEQARNKYRELSEEEKSIKREYGRNRYRNMSKKKKKLRKYQKVSWGPEASF